MFKITRKKVRTKFDKNCDMVSVVERFVNSGRESAKVDTSRHSSARSCATSLYVVTKREGLVHIKVMQRRGEVYLINSLLAPVIIP